MRIVHLPSSYLPDSVGGTETYVQTLCRELENLGHRTAVVWHAAGAPGAPLESPSRADGIDHAFRLPAIVHRSRTETYTRFAGQAPPGFRDFLRDWKPDVVHFHAFTLGAGEDHAECCRRENIPYVITYHTPAMSCVRSTLLRWGADVCDGRLDPRRCSSCGLEARGWPKPLARLAALSPLSHRLVPDSPLTTRFTLPSVLAESNARWRRFFGGARHVIACAEFCRDVLLANDVSADSVSVHRQALRGEDRWRTLRLPIAARVDAPLAVGYFGRINEVKGPDLLSAIVKGLRANGTNATGEWLGPLENDSRWAEAMFAAGAPYVRYAGVKRGVELDDWVRRRDLIVIPSRWLETGPLTLLEAWDQGTPAIGADRGGIRDFMTAAGLPQCLFAPGDAASATAAAKRMIAWSGAAPSVRVPGVRSLAERMLAIYDAAREPAAKNSTEEFASPGMVDGADPGRMSGPAGTAGPPDAALLDRGATRVFAP